MANITKVENKWNQYNQYNQFNIKNFIKIFWINESIIKSVDILAKEVDLMISLKTYGIKNS